MSDRYRELWVVDHDGKYATGLSAQNTLVMSMNNRTVDANPERIRISKPFDGSVLPKHLKPGDKIESVVGILDFYFGNWRVRPLSAIVVREEQPPAPEFVTSVKSTASGLVIATYNVENLNPKSKTFARLGHQIANQLNSPDIIALQEVQDDSGAKNDGVVSCDETVSELISSILEHGNFKSFL
jgi:predicted extracellular nuclease